MSDDEFDPRSASSLQDFAALLRRARVRAGNPSLRDLERWVRKQHQAGRQLPPLRRSTVADVLAGRRLPNSALLATFLEACGIVGAAQQQWMEAMNRIGPRELQTRSDPARRKVFISYVREDSAAVDRIASELRTRHIDAWLDRTHLDVGDRWKDIIRKAIRDGDHFLACFSPAYTNRRSTYMNEELLVAIEELRLRPRDRRWFLPITLGKCIIPTLPIGAVETLADIHYIDLFENWQTGFEKLIRVLTHGDTSDS